MKQKIVHKLTVIVLAAALAVSAAGCKSSNANASDAAQTAESEQEFETLNIYTPTVYSDGSAGLTDGFLIAVQEGYLEKELNEIGYTSNITGLAGAAVAVNEVLAPGEADIAVSGDFPANTYISKNGDDVEILANISTRIQLGILVNENITDPEDLKGKKIGTAIGTVAEKYLLNYLEENGLTEDDVEIVNGTTELASLFAGGDIDGIASLEQNLLSAQKKIGGEFLNINENEENLAVSTVLLGKTELLEKHPEIAEAFQNALNDAIAFAQKSPEAAYEDMAANSKGDYPAEDYAAIYSFDESFAYWKPELTEEVVDTLQSSADFQYDRGLLTDEVKVADHVWK